MAENNKLAKKKGVDTSDLNEDQRDMLKDLITKEIMKKIEKRVTNKDSDVIRTIKAMIEDTDSPKRKEKK